MIFFFAICMMVFFERHKSGDVVSLVSVSITVSSDLLHRRSGAREVVCTPQSE